jgi:hypothetical protein
MNTITHLTSAVSPSVAQHHPGADLHHTSDWWRIRAHHAPSPVVEVSLVQGKLMRSTNIKDYLRGDMQRHAAASASTGNDDGYVRDEDLGFHPSFTEPPIQGNHLQLPRVTIGEHECGRSYFCL